MSDPKYTEDEMRGAMRTLREAHLQYLDRYAVYCDIAQASDVRDHLRTVQANLFEPFARRCQPCGMLLKHVGLLQ